MYRDKANGSRIPEMFVWLVFHNLVVACLNLRKLDYPGPYVHCDIKPQNVLLYQSENQKSYRAYPSSILGDFGLYYRLDYEPITGDAGTEGHLAPEQYGPYPQSPVRVDIFQIGLLIWCMMRNVVNGLRDPPPGHQPFDPHAYGEWKKQFDNFDVGHGYSIGTYSRPLEALVQSCLEEDVRWRPDIGTLYESVKKGMDKCQARNGGLKSMTVDNLPEWEKVEYKKDEFIIGQPFTGRKHRPGQDDVGEDNNEPPTHDDVAVDLEILKGDV
ncbi:kinase-like domain-containing protein [Lophiotrema nucula]|uniref:non-specific serine/threonine protein kinase n=1 Tax=Lophiotrema nucula TaxID=690887 RepID=A0A6A5YZN2_9PLEO|nr:kinase-like domain-containing protein [Lophiotrema nucula]